MEIDRALENAARAQAIANAFITLRARDDLLADARRPGPLSGVLLSVKDDREVHVKIDSIELAIDQLTEPRLGWLAWPQRIDDGFIGIVSRPVG